MALILSTEAAVERVARFLLAVNLPESPSFDDGYRAGVAGGHETLDSD